MTAHLLLGIFDSVYVLALAAWVGSIAFFWFAVVPGVSSKLGAEAADRVVRALSPRFHAWGATAGAIALPAFIAGPLCYPEFRGPSVGLQAMLILGAILLTFYAGNPPRSAAAGKAAPASVEPTGRPQRRTMAINLAVLAIGVGLLIAFANRPAPRTTGIIERSPVERIRLEAEAATRRDATAPIPSPAPGRPNGDAPGLGRPD